MCNINEYQDIMDSRDVMARIEELEELREGDLENFNETEEAEELKELLEFATYKGEYHPEWEHGVTLIRNSYFKDYAQELAEEIGAIDGSENWPCNCIDWEMAARELRIDYTSSEFGGITYWYR